MSEGLPSVEDRIPAPSDLLIVGGPWHGSFAGPSVSVPGYLQTDLRTSQGFHRVWIHMSLFATGAEIKTWRDAVRKARLEPDPFR